MMPKEFPTDRKRNLISKWKTFLLKPSWVKVKWAILEYVAGESPVVINMEMKSYPVLEFKGPCNGALISKVNIEGFNGTNGTAIKFTDLK